MFSFKVTFFSVFLIVSFSRCYHTHSDFGPFNSEQSAKEKESLKKRSLTFPTSSLFQINMGVALARQLERNSAAMVLAIQQNIPLPEEALVISAKKFSIYDHFQKVISSYGFNGSECLKKMVCQISETPLLGGLLEDVITFVLTPSKHRGVGGDSEVEGLSHNLLLESERMGKLGGNCSSAFPECVRTPLDFISTFVHA